MNHKKKTKGGREENRLGKRYTRDESGDARVVPLAFNTGRSNVLTPERGATGKAGIRDLSAREKDKKGCGGDEKGGGKVIEKARVTSTKSREQRSTFSEKNRYRTVELRGSMGGD